MRELVRSNDLVVLSCAESLLQDAGIGCVILDRHMGASLTGLDGVAPRLVVASDDYAKGAKILTDGGLGPHVHDPD